MKYKKDTYRYLIISIIYIIAILFASLCIYFLPLPLWSSILIADIVAYLKMLQYMIHIGVFNLL